MRSKKCPVLTATGEAISSKVRRCKSKPFPPVFSASRYWFFLPGHSAEPPKKQAPQLRRAALLVAVGVSLAVAQNTPGFTAAAVIQSVSKTCDWYRQAQLNQQIADEPADLVYLADQQRMADQIVRLGFEFARQTEPLLEKPSSSNPSGSAATPVNAQALTQAAANLNQQLSQSQAQLEALKQARKRASRKKQAEIDSEIAVLESGLELLRARQDVVTSMIGFVTGTSRLGATDLHSEIEDLARTLPPSLSQAQPPEGKQPSGSEATAAKASLPNRPQPAGLLGLAGEWWGLTRKAARITTAISQTNGLAQSEKQLSNPLANRLKQLIQTGQQSALQANAGDSASLAEKKQELDALILEFKQVSAALVPISEQGVLLDLYQRSLANWRTTVKQESREVLESFLVRMAILAIVLGVVVGFGELLRRTIFRYVADARRRYQFLLLRKIGLWFGIGTVLVFALSTELRSVATFAGLITAGVAVALQGVIVSIVGYFFLIGKYGIRVGDRVNVAGVSGEVVDIGLVRFYLMELQSRGAESLPTGRIAGFSNSIVFQSSAGLFKQIPGTNFMWHEVKLTFAPESDYQQVEARLHQAVETAFRDYRDALEQQRQQLERNLSAISSVQLRPTVRLNFTAAGTEVVIDYPVVLRLAVEIDEKLMREVLAAVDHEPRLKLIGSEVATVKLVA
jgi:small-conductance mechanosensitive channel